MGKDKLIIFLMSFQKDRGRFPTFDEMEEATGYSRAGLARMVEHLEADGKVHRVNGGRRGARVAVTGTLADYCLSKRGGAYCMAHRGHAGTHNYVSEKLIAVTNVGTKEEGGESPPQVTQPA